ncbi:MAG: GLUG motif-containing protein [Eubacterium sp.]
MKRKQVKSILCLTLAALALLSLNGCYNNADNTDEDSSSHVDNTSETEETTESQIEHLSEVPNGYIGIYTVDDLKNAAFNVDANYILMNDIDLSSIDNWEGISNNSTFDGNNYTVSNLKSTESGLFSTANIICNFNVENVDIYLNIADCDINRDKYLGALADFAKEIENCSSSGKIKFTDSDGYWHIGGLIGATSIGIIKNCKSSMEITQPAQPIMGDFGCNIGGICGGCPSTFDDITLVENCEFLGKISAENATVGGVFGYSRSEEIKIYSSTNSGMIECSYSLPEGYFAKGYVGGIFGDGLGSVTIENCANTGKISGNVTEDSIQCMAYFGGIVGMNYEYETLNVHNCYNAGEIDANGTNKKVGAIVGSDKTQGLLISNCAYLENGSYGLTSTNAMFENCKSMTDKEMRDIRNYPFDNINEWKNIKDSYPKHIYISE